MRKAIIVLLFFVAATAVSQSPAAPAQSTKTSQAKAGTAARAAASPAAKPATALPTKEQVNEAMQRTLGYDPAMTWTVVEIRQSPIAGLADVMVSINKQPPQHIYFAPGIESAVIGEMIPFGSNPFAPARQLLRAADGPALGPKTPAIEIVEFSDLECPHCKAAAPIVAKLAADFPQVRIIFQQFPLPASLHPWAMKAALYADCAAQANKDAFWKYIDSVFENQGSIALATADDKLRQLAKEAGYDADKLAACAASPEAEARVNKSLDLGKSLDVNSTPTFFINGRRVPAIANIPYDQLKALVQFEIDHAGK
ncbi:MAG TPA: thioredoxin domain-containing protein [Candidatus Angelobacter sp.]|nr:thioredoxin domain-containing protein [Candidatus Angelobacter sp.]